MSAGATPIAEWDDSYAKLARAASQLRANGGNSSKNLAMGSREDQKMSIRAGLERLYTRLNTVQESRLLSQADVLRRRNLVDNLTRQVGGKVPDYLEGKNHTNGLGRSAGQPQQHLSQTQMALQQQDEMLNELSIGVGNLKDQANIIYDEGKSHNKLLDEMESNMSDAQMKILAETERAQTISEDKSLWRLKMYIAGLSVIMVILILTGL